MTMKNPPHPGLSVRHDCIEPFDLTITEAADILGVTRQALNNLVNGKSGISPEMAIRLDKAFGGGAKRGCGCKWRTISRRPAKAKLRSSELCGEGWTRRAPEVMADGAQRAATHAGHPFGHPNGLHSAAERDLVGVLRSRSHGGAGQ